MTKITKEVILYDHAKYCLDDCTLEDVLHQIKKWIQEYGGKATLDIGQQYEDYSTEQYAYVHIRGKREETDEEYAKRLTQESTYKEAQAARDKAEFERLSKVFGEKK